MTLPRSALAVLPAVVLGLVACTPEAQEPSGAPTGATSPSPPAATTEAPTATADPVPTTADPAPTTASPEPTTPPEPALGARGVASGHELASEAGMQMLTDGGSAVDAAIAAAFADAVLQPVSSGIGGGGSALVLVDGQQVAYDYREVVNEAGVIGDGASGVPGFVAGLQVVHAEHGVLDWADLIAPSIALAEDGVPVSGFLAHTLTTPLGSQATASLPHFQRSDGSPLRTGDQLVQTDLAQTLREIAEDPGTAYTGALAEQLGAVPGLDADSLAGYEVQVSVPVEGPVGEFTMLGAPPGLPGAAVIQLLQIAEAAGIGDLEPGSPGFIDLQTQAWRIAERTVQQDLGDPAFVDVPVGRIVDPDANASLADGLELHSAGALELHAEGGQTAYRTGAQAMAGEANTTHISVVDSNGDAVSMTNTVTSYFGSGRYVEGFFVNDALSRFDHIGTGANNTPAPGRRSVSWGAPTMLLDDQRRPVLVIGTPGGSQIPNVLAGVIARWALHGQDLAEAVPAPRYSLTGSELVVEPGAPADELRGLGYAVRVLEEVQRQDWFGSVQAVEVDWDSGELSSVADPRRAGGYVIQEP